MERTCLSCIARIRRLEEEMKTNRKRLLIKKKRGGSTGEGLKSKKANRFSFLHTLFLFHYNNQTGRKGNERGYQWAASSFTCISFPFPFSSERSLIARLKTTTPHTHTCTDTFKTGNICCCQHVFSTCRNEHGKM